MYPFVLYKYSYEYRTAERNLHPELIKKSCSELLSVVVRRIDFQCVQCIWTEDPVHLFRHKYVHQVPKSQDTGGSGLF